ncbi:Hypothetical predicted protein [Octopus vulgaris]|uniref:Uncharacterized protein n=1 Tax=Octopus vulgaris TaxID=6645 RepID=A0AA36BH15_OCTVU|nr:Hypothetical predicted protein [Octopus vulgaris]
MVPLFHIIPTLFLITFKRLHFGPLCNQISVVLIPFSRILRLQYKIPLPHCSRGKYNKIALLNIDLTDLNNTTVFKY